MRPIEMPYLSEQFRPYRDVAPELNIFYAGTPGENSSGVLRNVNL
jgi:hypothetical protein